MQCAARRITYGPAPAGFFITSKLVDAVPSLRASSLHDRVRALLTSAESDLFQPLLMLATPADFARTFELLSYKYFPLRLQALMLILDSIGVKRFRAEYFQCAPQFAASLAVHANDWGLDVHDVTGSFQLYFDSALKLIQVAPALSCAEPAQLLRLVDSITQIDYGFTALGLVFDGSIQAQPWCMSEVFRCSRSSLVEYGNTVDSIVAHLRKVDWNQSEMFPDNVAEMSTIASEKAKPRRVLPIRSEEPSLNKKAHERYSDFEYNYPW